MNIDIPSPYNEKLENFDRLVLVKIFKAEEMLNCINNYI